MRDGQSELGLFVYTRRIWAVTLGEHLTDAGDKLLTGFKIHKGFEGRSVQRWVGS